MPFRARLRKTFSRSSINSSSHSTTDSSSTSSLAHSSTKYSSQTIASRKDSNIYQPGEKMPPLKYRRPVQKEHKEHLEAFDFSKAWRRRSHVSVYSPHGSRMPSRAGSIVETVGEGNRRALKEIRGASSETDVSTGGTISDDGTDGSEAATSSAASEIMFERMESWSFSN